MSSLLPYAFGGPEGWWWGGVVTSRCHGLDSSLQHAKLLASLAAPAPGPSDFSYSTLAFIWGLRSHDEACWPHWPFLPTGLAVWRKEVEPLGPCDAALGTTRVTAGDVLWDLEVTGTEPRPGLFRGRCANHCTISLVPGLFKLVHLEQVWRTTE